ncbi:uncharacterized protein LOC115099285 isoform X1 [Rhinatrema bivittatum]|uniref:uncharacterized protein LOC115099285 isoform X1 n=1 Tax=Rhinatrema bivittatum TaxID=194408 RepID=UPI0011291796|nr:uncharacterized protein LOC115099285 isoform X1 [Rhinatrema bivittatum]
MSYSPHAASLPVSSLAQAQNLFLTAILCERAKSWKKVVEHYTKLLGLLSSKNLPENIQHEPYFRQLMYEIYYHLGIAFQNLNQHGKAVQQFTNAAETASIHKKGCAAGCRSRTCFHTPVLARRAYANVKCGSMKKAMEDAEMAIILDSFNPDVYCVRALVWSTMQNKTKAVVDLSHGLRLNSSHAGALVLRGALLKSLMGRNRSPDVRIRDHEKVLKVHHDAYSFLDVEDFNSPKTEQFYNRFLWSLNIPHTVVNLNWLTESESIFKPLDLPKRVCFKPAMPRNCGEAAPHRRRKMEPFHCGTLTTYPDGAGTERRLLYGKVLKEYAAKIKDNGISDRILRMTRKASARPDKSTACKLVHGSSVTRTAAASKTSLSGRMSHLKHEHQKQSGVSEAGYLMDAINIYHKPWRRNKLPAAEVIKKELIKNI